jgi:hypothetical protein
MDMKIVTKMNPVSLSSCAADFIGEIKSLRMVFE